jgi:hypothetical protein
MTAGTGVNGRWDATETSLPGGFDHGPLWRCPSDSLQKSDASVRRNYVPTQHLGAGRPGLGIWGLTWTGVVNTYSHQATTINNLSDTIGICSWLPSVHHP